MDLHEVAKNIAGIRETKKISQRELGEAIGKSATTIGDYERGRADIPCSALVAIAEKLEVSVSELFGEKRDDFCPEVEMRIYSQEDRRTVAGILVMNGYSIRQIKRPNQTGRSNYFCLQAKFEADSLALESR